MVKALAWGAIALFATASSLAYAQAPSAGLERLKRLTAADVGTLTDARLDVVKAALQLTPDQEKYWSAIEDAIRGRAKGLQTRIANAEKEAASRAEAITL
jgi:hypothetical protein